MVTDVPIVIKNFSTVIAEILMVVTEVAMVMI